MEMVKGFKDYKIKKNHVISQVKNKNKIQFILKFKVDHLWVICHIRELLLTLIWEQHLFLNMKLKVKKTSLSVCFLKCVIGSTIYKP